MKFTLEPATDSTHKWVGVFTDETTKAERRIPFGAKGYEDYTQHKNALRRQSYLSRHKTREDWSDPKTAGALSRWILWEATSLQEAVRKFKRRFSLT